MFMLLNISMDNLVLEGSKIFFVILTAAEFASLELAPLDEPSVKVPDEFFLFYLKF